MVECSSIELGSLAFKLFSQALKPDFSGNAIISDIVPLIFFRACPLKGPRDPSSDGLNVTVGVFLLVLVQHMTFQLVKPRAHKIESSETQLDALELALRTVRTNFQHILRILR